MAEDNNNSKKLRKEKNGQLKRVLNYFMKAAAKEKPMYFVLAVLSYVLSVCASFFNIIAPKYLIDMLIERKEVKQIIILAAVIVGVNTVVTLTGNLISQIMEKYFDYFDRYFSIKICQKSTKMNFEFTENPELLDMLFQADQCVTEAGGVMSLFSSFMSIIASVVTLFGVTTIIFTQAPVLLPVLILSIVVNALVNKKIKKIVLEFFPITQEIARRAGYVFGEMSNFRYGKDIRIYGADRLILKKAAEKNTEGIDIQKKRAWRLFPFVEIGALNGTVTSAISSLYVGFLAIAKIITVGDLSMLSNSIGTFTGSITGIIGQLQDLDQKSELMIRYVDFMEQYDYEEHGTRSVPDSDTYEIEFRNVSFRYPRAEGYALKNVSLTLKPGEHLAVVGMNGAGKTTFIKLLARLYQPTEGEILLNGVNINEFVFDEYVKKISAVFQDFTMFAFSLKENIALANAKDAPDEVVMKACVDCGLGDKLEKLPNGIHTQVFKEFDPTGFEPSGGELQKIAIARALYKDSPIVILDEPTAALDPISEHEIYTHFGELTKGRTAIYISHRLSSCQFCDRIAVFAEGNLVEVGTHESLMNSEQSLYKDMFMVQMQYYQPLQVG